MEIKICDIIKEQRKMKNLSQEALAEVFGVTIQAVSKWETQSSLPDVTLLPLIADYFGITMDYLFFGVEPIAIVSDSNDLFPNDKKLRIVQYKGNRLLSKHEYDPNVRIMLEMDNNDFKDNKPVINVEVWGSADIKGNVSGNVNAGDYVNCGAVSGNVNAGDGINCGAICGNVEAGDGINCGDISGNVNAGDGINCGNIGGSVDAGDSVSCGNIGGKVNAGDSVSCGNIGGNVNAGDGISCGDIGGDVVSCDGDIECRMIKGNVNCGGDIIYKK